MLESSFLLGNVGRDLVIDVLCGEEKEDESEKITAHVD